MIDSFPIAFCDNYRIPRARLYQVRSGVGYQASKKRSFYGLKIYLMVTEQGQPVEFFLTSGSYSDTKALTQYQFDLPTEATVIGDKAYTDDSIEDMMSKAGLTLLPRRKDNAKCQVPLWTQYLQCYYRKVVETTGSMLERLLPKSIHAVTARGFELKVALFVLACSLNYLGSNWVNYTTFHTDVHGLYYEAAVWPSVATSTHLLFFRG